MPALTAAEAREYRDAFVRARRAGLGYEVTVVGRLLDPTQVRRAIGFPGVYVRHVPGEWTSTGEDVTMIGIEGAPVAASQTERKRQLERSLILFRRSAPACSAVRRPHGRIIRAPRARRRALRRSPARSPGRREPDEPHDLDLARLDGRLGVVRGRA